LAHGPAAAAADGGADSVSAGSGPLGADEDFPGESLPTALASATMPMTRNGSAIAEAMIAARR
jgi:hypothetical protein